MTPTTVRTPSISILLPTTDRSAPKRVVQTAWLRMVTGAAFGRSSCGVNARPSAGAAPSVSKHDADTPAVATRADSPRSRTPGQVEDPTAAAVVKLQLCSRHSSNVL